LAAFAQFGSDLDPATRAQITRGERLVEILKQPQYKPLPVEEQIFMIFAGTNRFLDDVSRENVKKFQDQFLGFMRDRHPAIGKEIRDTKQLSGDLEPKLRAAIEEFKKTFQA